MLVSANTLRILFFTPQSMLMKLRVMCDWQTLLIEKQHCSIHFYVCISECCHAVLSIAEFLTPFVIRRTED
jgi:hypothetical protein